MISTKGLFGKSAKAIEDLAIEPVEPVTIEGEMLAEEIQTYLRRASDEQQALIAESNDLGQQMADLLAAKELGRPVDPESLITVAERRQAVKQQLEAVEYRIAGLQAQQDALRATEDERRRTALLPQLQASADLGDALVQQFALQMAAVSETIEQITANRRHFQELSRDWDRVSRTKGHGFNQPREVWQFFVPELKRVATYSNPEGRRSVAQQIDWELFTGPAQRRAEWERDMAIDAQRAEEKRKAEQAPYIAWLQQKRDADRNGYRIDPYPYVKPDGWKELEERYQ